MTLIDATIVNAILMIAVLGLLAFVMTRAGQLDPHRNPRRMQRVRIVWRDHSSRGPRRPAPGRAPLGIR